MEVQEVLKTRRAYRSLEPFPVTDSLLSSLGEAAQLAPSCSNSQPWRFVFTHDPKILELLFAALSPGNQWAEKSSLMITVFSRKEDGCVFQGREYFLFDTGIATGFLMLRATDLNLVIHPMAGFDPIKVRTVLEIPENFEIMALLAVGKKASRMDPTLSEKQKEGERQRPERKPLNQFIFSQKYSK